MNNLFLESVNILAAGGGQRLRDEVMTILEDAESPATRTYLNKLYDSVVSKGHIDFGDIPNSKGDITKYKGYNNIKEIIPIIVNLGTEYKTNTVIECANTISSAISRMESLSDVYMQGFTKKNDYVILEYNTYVYTIVQATSALIYEFVDFIKRPNSDVLDITIKNTNRRPSMFYFNQLNRFLAATGNTQYKQYLLTMINKGRDNFIGTETAIGIGVVMTAAIAVVPITRELVYQFYNIRAKVSDYLLQQAYFLELNKARVESNSTFDAKKRRDIINKQEAARKNLIKISEKIRVDHVQSEYSKDKMLSTDNSLLTIKHVNREVEDGKLSLM